ncbi:MAG: HEPN domain-containing protein [Sulfuricellaceae bacterium]|nr:HEPN domain-containing protein [Sulfuricellaceae bacterium]
MTPQLEEAERLFRLARRDQVAFEALLNASGVDLALACFHAQQAAEKALKAIMCLHGLEYRRTHDLEELAAKLTGAGFTPPISEAQFSRLTPYAVEFRYDDDVIHLVTGSEAAQLLFSLLAWVGDEIHKHE